MFSGTYNTDAHNKSYMCFSKLLPGVSADDKISDPEDRTLPLKTACQNQFTSRRLLMKKKLLTSLLCIMAVVLCVMAFSSCEKDSDDGDNDDGNFEEYTDFEFYVTSDGECELKKYTGNDSEVTIPSEYNGNPVVGIKESAFKGNLSVTKVTIPESVKKIDDYAFSGCGNLTNATIPQGVTEIGNGTFFGCRSLGGITIPENVTKISANAFSECSGLTEITIPENVREIGDYAFSGCSNLTNITIPGSITEIGDYVFWGCDSLNYYEDDRAYYLGNDGNRFLILYRIKDTDATSFEFNEKTKIVYYNAFSRCSNLTNITIPDSVTQIGAGAFSGCGSLTDITISGSVTEIERETFFGCSSLAKITIPESVTEIGDGVFSGCSSLTEITIPENVTEIGAGAFYGCTELKRAVFAVDGWNVFRSSEDVKHPISVSDASDAAKYLTDTYKEYQWER